MILTSFEYMEVQQIRAGEYYGLILFGAVGMCLMSSAVELVLIFIALEISSISTYILAGFRRRAAISSRIVAEVFPAGIVCDGIFSVWRGADVRRDRIDQHFGSSLRRCIRGRVRLLVYLGSRTDVCWPWIQGCRRTVPCLDARRLRRRTRAGCRLHVHCAQSCGFAVLLRVMFDAKRRDGSG